MGSFLNFHLHPEARGKRLFKANAHSQTNDGSETAMGNGRGDEHGHRTDRGLGITWRTDVNVR